VKGGEHNDRVHGGPDVDRVFGDDGRDLVSGGRGADVLVAGSGNDAVYGNEGADEAVGGAGNDTLWGLTLADVPLPGVDTLRGESGSDTFRTRDGEPDQIDCGEGRKDRALVDFVDVIVDATPANPKGSCETVTRAAPKAKEDAPENSRESPSEDSRES
jgi:hypothetical protein